MVLMERIMAGIKYCAMETDVTSSDIIAALELAKRAFIKKMEEFAGEEEFDEGIGSDTDA